MFSAAGVSQPKQNSTVVGETAKVTQDHGMSCPYCQSTAITHQNVSDGTQADVFFGQANVFRFY